MMRPLIAVLGLIPSLLAGQMVARRHVGTSPADSSGDVPSWQRATGGWVRGGVVHYGKWLLAAGAVGFTILGEHEHRRSQRFWTQLLRICQAENQSCAVDDSGRYLDYQAELLYQESVYYDHRARRRLVAGQLSLLGAAAMFIADLSHKGEKPDNIPFRGMTVMPVRDGVGIGMRVAF